MIREGYIKRQKKKSAILMKSNIIMTELSLGLKRWQKKSSNIASHMQVNGKKMSQKMMNEKAQH